MSNEQWSEWIEWNGGKCQLRDGAIHEVQFRSGEVCKDDSPETSYWIHDEDSCDIIAYRYRLDDNTMKQESDMHPDLEWLARNVSEWRAGVEHMALDEDGEVRHYPDAQFDYFPENIVDAMGSGTAPGCGHYSESEWLQARKDLGLIMTEEEAELPAQEWDGYVDADDDEAIPTRIKQLRYQDAKGEDWIDEFARTATVDEFRGAMRFTIGKYNRRAGKKDELIKEIEKMRDYCDRWIQYERTL